MANRSSQGNRSISSVYLLFYNGLQLAGWTYIGLISLQYYMQKQSYIGLYQRTEWAVKVFQTAAVFEIVHNMIGIVKGNFIITGAQVFSRVMLVWGVLHSVPQVQNIVGFPMLLAAWVITEIIRYAYYSLNIMLSVPYVLQWCRYSLFIVLYPIGITGELLCLYNALPYYKSSGMYSLSLPNFINWSFNFQYFVIYVMLSYIPVFPKLYFHMFSQRRKIIGGELKKE